jgi:hypothetical protein
MQMDNILLAKKRKKMKTKIEKVRLIGLHYSLGDLPNPAIADWYGKYENRILEVRRVRHDKTFDFKVLGKPGRELALLGKWWVSPHEVEFDGWEEFHEDD